MGLGRELVEADFSARSLLLEAVLVCEAVTATEQMRQDSWCTSPQESRRRIVILKLSFDHCDEESAAIEPS